MRAHGGGRHGRRRTRRSTVGYGGTHARAGHRLRHVEHGRRCCGSPDGRLRPLLFDGSPLLPSAVYLGTDGRMLVGRDAERHARLDPSRFEPNPKRRVDDGTVFLGDREMPVAQVFAPVLGTVAIEARRQPGRRRTRCG